MSKPELQKVTDGVRNFKKLTRLKKKKYLLRQLVESLYLYKYDENHKSLFIAVLDCIKQSGLFDLKFLIIHTIKYERIFCANRSGQLLRFLKKNKQVPVFDFTDFRHFSIIELEKVLEN